MPLPKAIRTEIKAKPMEPMPIVRPICSSYVRHFNAMLGGMCLFRGCAFVVCVILFAAHQEDDLNQCDQTRRP